MAVQIRHTDFTPDWGGADVGLRAQGQDPSGSIRGGTMGVYDFQLTDFTPDSWVAGTEFENLRVGGAPALGVSQNGNGTASTTGIHAAGGIPLTSISQKIKLPNMQDNPGTRSFDLLSLGDDPSALLFCHINIDTAQGSAASSTKSIMGYANGGAASHQWSMVYDEVNGNIVCRVFGVTAATVTYSATTGASVLIAMHIENNGDGSFTLSVYEDGVLQGSSGGTYPFRDPKTAVPTEYPNIGALGGYNSSLTGMFYRVGGHQITDAYNVASWLTTEGAAGPA